MINSATWTTSLSSKEIFVVPQTSTTGCGHLMVKKTALTVSSTPPLDSSRKQCSYRFRVDNLALLDTIRPQGGLPHAATVNCWKHSSWYARYPRSAKPYH